MDIIITINKNGKETIYYDVNNTNQIELIYTLLNRRKHDYEKQKTQRN